MGFYKSIAQHYEQIFPLNRAQIEFTQEAVESPENMSLLDVGCGTGQLTSELSDIFRHVTGIDLDEEMIRRARETNPQKDNLEFRAMDMNQILAEFNEDAFDVIVCYGNTLVHLEDSDQVAGFLKLAKAALAAGGKLLLQIINYDRILDQKIESLPVIDNEDITFIRKYSFNADNQFINFQTNLKIKSSHRSIENNIRLYPLRKQEVELLLMQAGFEKINYYGNFKKDPFTTESIPLVIEAFKQ